VYEGVRERVERVEEGKEIEGAAGVSVDTMTRKCDGRVKEEREREMLFFRTNLSNNGLNLSRS
jgi:hypothetical protein